MINKINFSTFVCHKIYKNLTRYFLIVASNFILYKAYLFYREPLLSILTYHIFLFSSVYSDLFGFPFNFTPLFLTLRVGFLKARNQSRLSKGFPRSHHSNKKFIKESFINYVDICLVHGEKIKATG